jgi:ubiquinone/menaquinone biosynthesis C-methylase UbiE
MSVEERVSTHYTTGALEQKILGALQIAGKDPAHLCSDDIAPLDNFHLGGRQAIVDLAGFMHLRPGMHLLDVGCGVGGPARYFAEQGCRVTGLDLTEEFVQVAESLTQMLKLEGKAQFRQGSALEMPFPSDTFDGAYMIHVGMNIEDKAGVFREVARVLKRGARFSIFDIMQTGDGPLEFPLPWAVSAETSFVRTTEDYRKALEAAGLRVEHERGRRQFAEEEMQRRMSRGPSGTSPVIGVHILMGDKAPAMLRNVNQAIVGGQLEPVEIVAVAGER